MFPTNPRRAELLGVLLKRVSPFEVADTFSYTTGLKIGLVAYYPEAANENAFSEVAGVDGIPAEKIETVLAGAQDAVKIYTVRITLSGDRHTTNTT